MTDILQNLVRQSLYYNIDYYKAKGEGAFVNDDNIVKHHVCEYIPWPISQSRTLINSSSIAHCLDIIRQQLMCQLDTGVLGQVWWDKEAPKAFVDFKCVFSLFFLLLLLLQLVSGVSRHKLFPKQAWHSLLLEIVILTPRLSTAPITNARTSTLSDSGLRNVKFPRLCQKTS